MAVVEESSRPGAASPEGRTAMTGAGDPQPGVLAYRRADRRYKPRLVEHPAAVEALLDTLDPQRMRTRLLSAVAGEEARAEDRESAQKLCRKPCHERRANHSKGAEPAPEPQITASMRRPRRSPPLEQRNYRHRAPSRPSPPSLQPRSSCLGSLALMGVRTGRSGRLNPSRRASRVRPGCVRPGQLNTATCREELRVAPGRRRR